MAVWRRGEIGGLALLGAIGAWAQSSGAAVGAPPPIAEGLLDCSLYRYGDRLDEAVAEVLGRFASRLDSSAELQAASSRASRVEVTELLRRERLIHRVLDCPQPVLRGFVSGRTVELELSALQAAVCQQLLDSAALADLGTRVQALNVPSGEPRCRTSRNPVPGLLTFGRFTQAGRSLPGENTVTMALASGLVRPARCETSDPPNAGATPAYVAHLRRMPANVDCRIGREPEMVEAATACRSLYEAGVSCSGNRVAACRSALDEVDRAWSDANRSAFAGTALRAPSGSTAERAELLERLLTVLRPEQLAGFTGTPAWSVEGLARRQGVALTALLDDGAANIDADHERSQREVYAGIEAALVDRWLPRIVAADTGAVATPAAAIWAGRLDTAQRRALLREGFEAIAAGLGLGRKRLFLIGDCNREKLDHGLIGGYLRPGVAGTFVDRDSNRDASMADAVVLCGNSTQAFADFELVVATLLEEAMHARQMEIVMQALLLGRSADAATCRHARLMAAANLHASNHECPVYDEAALKTRDFLAPFGNFICFFVNKGRYPNWPHEFHAKAFAERIGARVVEAAGR